MTWSHHALLDVVHDVSGGNAKIAQRDYLGSGALAVVDQGQPLIGGFTDSIEAQLKSPGPVIVFGDHTKRLKFVDFPFAMGADGVKVLQVRAGWDPKFVFHFLQTVNLPNVGYSRHFKFLKEVRVPRPSIEEQRHIVAILDQASTVLARADLFSTALSEVPASYYEAHIARTPRRALLKDVAEFVRGVSFKPRDKVEPGPDTIAVMRTKNVQHTLDRSDELHIPHALVRNESKLLRVGDTLVSSANSWNLVGRACFIDQLESPAAVGGFVSALRPIQDFDSSVLFYWFTSPSVQATVRSFSSQTTNIANLNLSRCLELPVPVPPDGLIGEFRELSDRVGSWRLKAEARLRHLCTLNQSLHARAFSGRL